ncbi:heparan-alpha-glucosaminide N-acetyltransferase-like [Spea bombifrons]|uniref:heparan-alpha-glucosaminide N-acetyltransferase-like n=1 Tax=Spea bombifrons TaxID=233779 RepID=UPI002348F8E8|nr:heparan-alpha-glucosaminide N-acetyltransferase-like [Spea bombifrons]
MLCDRCPCFVGAKNRAQSHMKSLGKTPSPTSNYTPKKESAPLWELGMLAGAGLKFDEALLTMSNHLPEALSVLYVSDYCYQCPPQLLLTVSPASGVQPANGSVVLSTRFTLSLQVVVGTGGADPVCSWSELYEERGHYVTSVRSASPGRENNTGSVTCARGMTKPPANCYLPLLVAFGVLLGIGGAFLLFTYVSRLDCTRSSRQNCPGLCRDSSSPARDGGTDSDVPRSPRLLSLDTFRGFSLTLMVFVNYGGGGYWFFQHAPWNGLTVADLVMPWFVFIIGTSIALAFNSLLKKGVKRVQLLRKMVWRTCVLMAIGVFFLNYGPADGPLSWRWARIPGVLQRLGFTYLVVALMHAHFSLPNLDGGESRRWAAGIWDIAEYWPEWIIMAALETLSLCLTFFLPVPGCPTGYLGPGGIGNYGKYENCTGGAAGYIDKWLLGANHIYHYPTCKELYKTTQPFDPEGILGTINSVVMAFLGLQAGKIILIYRKYPLRVLKRFLIWAVMLGIISAILTKFTRDEGFIPVNKNLWSLSFVTTLGCFSFLLLGLMFYVIDVRRWWNGRPFIYPGMNSILVYVGHSLLGTYFPFEWEIKDRASHYEVLAQDLLGASIWVFVSYLLYRKKFFLKI